MVRDEAGRILFVRHTYGDRDAWELPGGGVHRDEDDVAAARREAREELGIDLDRWRELGAIDGVWHGARLHLACLVADWPGGVAPDRDPVEIAEVGWFALDDPPRPLGPVAADALPVLAELRG